MAPCCTSLPAPAVNSKRRSKRRWSAPAGAMLPFTDHGAWKPPMAE
jgi:hypothetical protein